MTHAENKVEWCLKKAERELKESHLHRGLINVEPSASLVQKHIKKAEHNLKAAQFFNENGYSDWSASAFFYCIYHCFLAILLKYGYESRNKKDSVLLFRRENYPFLNQECTLAVIEMLIEKGIIQMELKYLYMLNLAKAKEVDHSIIEIREEFQYGTETAYTKIEEFEYFVKSCQEIINLTNKIVIQN